MELKKQGGRDGKQQHFALKYKNHLKWQLSESLPTVDNPYALGALPEVPPDVTLVQAKHLHFLFMEIFPCGF